PSLTSGRGTNRKECGCSLADKEKSRPQTVLSRESFLNAMIVLQAIGGSTNAVVHLMAIINRHPDVAGTMTLDTLDQIGRTTPLLRANYMTDFHNAGGMAALLTALRPLLHLDAKTVTGKTLGEELDSACFTPFPYTYEIIRPLEQPLYPHSALAVVMGNLAPNGAILKAAASKDRRLLIHSGPAVVFENTVDMAKRIDDPHLDVTERSVLVLKGVGPIGNPGMPEAGVIPIPRELAAQGVQDMLRISDGRMSGTAGGTIILHVSPESAVAESVFGVVEDGDMIDFNLETRSLNLRVWDDEIARRINSKSKSTECRSVGRARKVARGHRGLYERCVNQAELGCDFDFLTAEGPENV
ncbi:putative dihydroxy-acid dehydratase, partial [Aureobasidium pullulans]